MHTRSILSKKEQCCKKRCSEKSTKPHSHIRVSDEGSVAFGLLGVGSKKTEEDN